MREACYEQEGNVLAVRLEVGEMLDMRVLALLQSGLPGAAKCRMEMRGEFRWLLFDTAGYRSILQYQQKGWNKAAFLKTAYGIAYHYREFAEKGIPSYMVSTNPAHILTNSEGTVELICIPLESQPGEGIGAVLKNMVFEFPFVQNEDDSYISVMIRELFNLPRITPEDCLRCLQKLDPSACRQEIYQSAPKERTVLVADVAVIAQEKEEAHRKAEEEERRKAEEEAHRKAEEEAHRKAEEEERRKAEEEAYRKAEEEARRKAEEEAHRKAEEEERRKAEEEERRKAEEEARHKEEAVYYLRRNKTGEMYRLDQDICRIGKRENADFDLSDNPSVSRRHAVLVRRNGKWYLRDSGSLNRTFVNGKRLEFETDVEIHPGDRLRFADEQVMFIEQ